MLDVFTTFDASGDTAGFTFFTMVVSRVLLEKMRVIYLEEGCGGGI